MITAHAPDVSAAIRARALHLGFDRVGFCDASPPVESSHFERWLSAGMHGGMSWLERGRAKRLDPALVLPGVRSLIVTASSYAVPSTAATGEPPGRPAETRPRGLVSRYARGDDYHRVLGERLAALAAFVVERAPGHRALSYVDTGPLLERMWAGRAGIGWIGKNALVLNRTMGSFFFLGAILTTLRLPPDEPATDHCGSCTLCIDACPTGAIVEPRIVDSRRCISYHTIELRGALPEEHRAAIGDRLFGCDDCQDACPWNGEGAGFVSTDLIELLFLSRDEYQRRFRGSAIKRATYQGLRRNAAAALGNLAADPASLEALERVAGDAGDDPIVREQARWSSQRVRGRLGGE